MTKADKYTVLGGGAWGTALSLMLTRAECDVVLWARDPNTVESIKRRQQNPKYLPHITFERPLEATSDFRAALKDASVVFVATPAQTTRRVLSDCLGAFADMGMSIRGVRFVLCAKGLERTSLKSLDDVAFEIEPRLNIGVLSGPAFAYDLAKGLPTAVTFAMACESEAGRLAHTFVSPCFRPYISTDVRGVLIGGALKNVLAISCGIAVGRGLGASAHAALLTRGFSEFKTLGKALGARPATLEGLSGLGDLILTCSNARSRNFSYGQARARGEEETLQLVEGAFTAEVVASLCESQKIEAPICYATHAVLNKTATIDTMIDTLMRRPLKAE